MKDAYLMVLEVSQKQSYIFNEKKLANNVIASDTIAYVTSSAFFQKDFPSLYDEKENLIYAGGGHTFLVFFNKKDAEAFARAVSYHVLTRLPGLELFIKLEPWQQGKTPGQNIGFLLNQLDNKKGIRKSGFYQSTFGLERSGRRISISGSEADQATEVDNSYRKQISEYMKALDVENGLETAPENYYFVDELSKLGGSKGKNNFIAVIHIDGNQMGARVQNLEKIIKKRIDKKLASEMAAHTDYSKERAEFEIWRRKNKEFSDGIDKDFKSALKDVYDDLKAALDRDLGKTADQFSGKEQGILQQLNLCTNKMGETAFPLRKVIAAGDDICFITEGRLGLECAVRFMEHLAAKKVDGDPYAACAGVAIVHQKYPFYRVYELAEELCSNAKKVMAKRCAETGKTEGSLCAIDWHIEYGELQGDLDIIRENLVDKNGEPMYARPYQVGSDGKSVDPTLYDWFRRLVLTMNHMESDPLYHTEIARNKLKGLRNEIRNGKNSMKKYCMVNRFPDTFTDIASPGEVFDALEIMDVFLPIERSGKK